MKLEDFGYHLPPELIAQYPCDLRDESRMMVIRRKTGDIECRIFHDLPEFIRKDDVLVINDTKVIPARLIGKKATGGMIEILLLSRRPEDSKLLETWEVLLRPAKRVRVGTRISIRWGMRSTGHHLHVGEKMDRYLRNRRRVR